MWYEHKFLQNPYYFSIWETEEEGHELETNPSYIHWDTVAEKYSRPGNLDGAWLYLLWASEIFVFEIFFVISRIIANKRTKFVLKSLCCDLCSSFSFKNIITFYYLFMCMWVGTGDTTHKGHKQWESVFSSHGVGPGIKCRPSGMEADACPCWAGSQVLWSLTFRFSYQTVEWDKGAQDTFPRAHWDVNIFCIHVTIARPGRKRWKKVPQASDLFRLCPLSL